MGVVLLATTAPSEEATQPAAASETRD
jgi:hypothetical protein